MVHGPWSDCQRDEIAVQKGDRESQFNMRSNFGNGRVNEKLVESVNRWYIDHMEPKQMWLRPVQWQMEHGRRLGR
jgi:hypothetical protein